MVGSETSNGSRLSWADRQLRRRARTSESLRRASDLEASAHEVRPWWSLSADDVDFYATLFVDYADLESDRARELAAAYGSYEASGYHLIDDGTGNNNSKLV